MNDRTIQEARDEGFDDVISRTAAIEAMEDVYWYHINNDVQLVHGANSKEDEPLYKAEDVYKVLNDIPSAQPKRKRGKWINSYKRQTCSVCKQRGYRSWSFCPSCGADMRGEQDEQQEDDIS